MWWLYHKRFNLFSFHPHRTRGMIPNASLRWRSVEAKHRAANAVPNFLGRPPRSMSLRRRTSCLARSQTNLFALTLNLSSVRAGNFMWILWILNRTFIVFSATILANKNTLLYYPVGGFIVAGSNVQVTIHHTHTHTIPVVICGGCLILLFNRPGTTISTPRDAIWPRAF